MFDFNDVIISGARDKYSEQFEQSAEFLKAWDLFTQYEKNLTHEQSNRLQEIICYINHVCEMFFYMRGLKDGAALILFLTQKGGIA